MALLRRTTVLVPLILYLFLSLITFAVVWRDPFALQLNQPVDSQQLQWFWAWTPYALTHGLNPFFSSYIDYPTGVNLTWNTATSLWGLVMWPVTATLGLPFAFNITCIVSVALAAWTAFLLVRRFVHSPIAAAVGGLLYGFSPYVLIQVQTHLNLALVFLTPLVLLLVDEIIRVQRRPRIVLAVSLALACAAEFLINEEVLVGTGLLLANLLGLAAVLWPQQVGPRLRTALPVLAAAVALFVVLLAYPLAFQLWGPYRIQGIISARGVWVTDLLNFIVPTQFQQFTTRRGLVLTQRYTGNASEWNAYVGVPLLLLLVAISIVFRRSRLVQMACLAAILMALLSLGPTLHIGGVVHPYIPSWMLALPLLLLQRWVPAHAAVLLAFGGWFALTKVDLLGDALPDRLMVDFYLLAGFAVAVFLDSALRGGPARAWLGLLVVCLALVPLLPREPALHTDVRIPAFFTGPQAQQIPAGSVAVVFPMAGPSNADAMQWQAAAHMRFRMPEGYAFRQGARVDSPDSRTLAVNQWIEEGMAPPIGDEATRAQVEAELSGWQVRTVVIGPMAHEDSAVAYFSWVLGRPPGQEGGVHVWWIS